LSSRLSSDPHIIAWASRSSKMRGAVLAGFR
jgi:hypothetical protein